MGFGCVGRGVCRPGIGGDDSGSPRDVGGRKGVEPTGSSAGMLSAFSGDAILFGPVCMPQLTERRMRAGTYELKLRVAASRPAIVESSRDHQTASGVLHQSKGSCTPELQGIEGGNH